MEDTVFAKLSDDVVLNIFFKLEDDPRNWARVACVSTKFSSLIRTVCWRNKCTTSIPSVVSDLLSSATATSPPGGWAALHKLAVCCPGLLHSGVLLENSDFGLERELGPDETFRNSLTFNNNNNTDTNTNNTPQTHEASSSSNSCSWSLFDDLYLDTVYDVPGSTEGTMNPVDAVENSNSVGVGVGVGTEYSVVSKRRKTEDTMNPVDAVENSNSVGVGVGVIKVGTEYSVVSKRRKTESTMNPVDAVENSNSVGVGVGVGTEYSVVSKRRKTEDTMNPVDAVENSNSVGVGVGVIKVGTEYSVVSKRRKTESTMNPVDAVDNSNSVGVGVVKVGTEYSGVSKRRKKCRSMRSHLASGVWNLSREQGSKLLARQFRDDCLYICDWPGCVHIEDKRNYMLFRGIFKNFKRSRVWRTINDGNRSRVDLNCAFCECKQTWDLHSAFCLRRFFGYHDDGEPVVRAYVCENGHVSGAWTDWPLYT